jgi:hypothetical protein
MGELTGVQHGSNSRVKRPASASGNDYSHLVPKAAVLQPSTSDTKVIEQNCVFSL